MRIRERTLIIAVLLCAITAGGCTLFTGPKSHPVTISVTPETLAADVRQAGDITWLEFTIPVSIHNGQSSGLPIDFCLASVQDASGAVVWAPLCSAIATTTPTIAPGETKTYQWQVVAAIRGPGGPKWGGQSLDGTYRLRLAMGAEAVFVSNDFAISVLTTSAAAAKQARARVAPRSPPSAFGGARPNRTLGSRRP